MPITKTASLGLPPHCRASQAEADLADARQQADWQSLRIGELQQTSSVGQLMRKYEGEVQRLRAQFDAERRSLQQQLAQAQAAKAPLHQQQSWQQAQGSGQGTVSGWAAPTIPDGAAWAELFEEPSHHAAADLQDAWVQTEGSAGQQRQELNDGADPALLEAARREIEQLQEVNASLLESQTQGEGPVHDCARQAQRQQPHQGASRNKRTAATQKLDT